MINEKSDEELMNKIQMLLAQVGEAAKQLDQNGIRNNITVYSDGSVHCDFYTIQDITPGKVRKS